MNFLLETLIALVPSIVGPILCMLLLKTEFLKVLNKPIDNNVVLKDGKRLFGDNKTIRGLIIYIISTIIISVVWGLICENITFLNDNNALYQLNQNDIFFNIIIGFLYGSAYAIFELPNSFIKRRFGVNDSNVQEISKVKKYTFRIFDLIDSAFGCVLVLTFFYSMTILEYILLVIVGGIFHYIIIAILYKLKIKKQM